MKSLLTETGILIRFGGVGLFATVIHLGVAGLLFWAWPQISIFFANLIAFLVAFQASFWGHRHVTFRKPGKMRRFFAIALGGFAINNLLLGGIVGFSTLHGFWAISVATLLVPIFVYILARYWAFVH